MNYLLLYKPALKSSGCLLKKKQGGVDFWKGGFPASGGVIAIIQPIGERNHAKASRV
jgi:hypothetical protein